MTSTIIIMGLQVVVTWYYDPGQPASMDRWGFDEAIPPSFEIESIEAWGSDGRLGRIDLEAFSDEFLRDAETAIKKESEDV